MTHNDPSQLGNSTAAFSTTPVTVSALSGVTALLWLFCAVAADAADTPSAGEKVPLAQVLNANGTLNTGSGFSGTLDPTGYQMVTGPGGAPRFVTQADHASCDPEQIWDNRFAVI